MRDDRKKTLHEVAAVRLQLLEAETQARENEIRLEHALSLLALELSGEPEGHPGGHPRDHPTTFSTIREVLADAKKSAGDIQKKVARAEADLELSLRNTRGLADRPG